MFSCDISVYLKLLKDSINFLGVLGVWWGKLVYKVIVMSDPTKIDFEGVLCWGSDKRHLKDGCPFLSCLLCL